MRCSSWGGLTLTAQRPDRPAREDENITCRESGDQLGDSFVPAYLGMLRAGGSMSPESLTSIVGCDLTDPGFWSAGLDIVEGQLDAAVDAARAAGRL